MLNARLNMGGPGGASYYSFTPHEAWQIVVLDGYDVSMLGWPQGHPLHQQACRTLDKRNPNQVHMHAISFMATCTHLLPYACKPQSSGNTGGLWLRDCPPFI